MNTSHLKIDTSLVGKPISPNSRNTSRSATPGSAHPKKLHDANIRMRRARSGSNASSSSSLSIISPTSSSTNASSTSLHIQNDDSYPILSNSLSSPTSSLFDDPGQLEADYVLAMHDYMPHQQGATCLSFRAGQVIHVLNRDNSGWWDGELEGRRGWFPSNYVHTELHPLADEEPPDVAGYSPNRHSDASTVSWSSTPSLPDRDPSRSHHPPGPGADRFSYCPPLMIPLLHGLALLQSAARAKRITHFQPSTACIISCVRSVLSATDCLPREAPLLKQHPVLLNQRKRILSVLASLVAQAKKASENVDSPDHDDEVDIMLTLGGEVFSHVRRFLSIAVHFGVELPERRNGSGSASLLSRRGSEATFAIDNGLGDTSSRHGEIIATTGSTLRARSTGDLKKKRQGSTDEEWDPSLPLLPNRTSVLAQSKEQQYALRLALHNKMSSISSTGSSSSLSSLESVESTTIPSFPSGPSTTAQVVEALRLTHDHYLSTIAAFIGHAHSHSRSSHASTTGHMYDLVREIVEMACKLLTIVEAVMRHPEMPTHKIGSLKAAKEGLYNVTTSLADSVRLLTASMSPTMSEEDEKQVLLRSATNSVKAGADCVAAVKSCLNRSQGERPFIVYLPKEGEITITGRSFGKSNRPGGLSELYGLIRRENEEDLTIQAQPSPPPLPTKPVASASAEFLQPMDTRPDEPQPTPSTSVSQLSLEAGLPSPGSRTDDGTSWDGSHHQLSSDGLVDEKVQPATTGQPFSVPPATIPVPVPQDPDAWIRQHDFPLDEVAYSGEGHLVGATMEVLVEKMTPHDRIVDPAFSAVFFLTFRLFSTPTELVQSLIARYNLLPPPNFTPDKLQMWQQRKGVPVRLRVSNFIKLWLEMYWRAADSVVLPTLTSFTREGLGVMFPGPSQRILELIEIREKSADITVSERGDRMRGDPGMSINPPTPITPSEVPRPTMTKTLLAALRTKSFATISITDFDALELARQLTIMECSLYCSIQPEEVLESGQEGTKPPANVRAMSTLSTVITGWVAENILNEHDIKKRTHLVKFFIKVADRCSYLNNFSTPRSILAALDSSTISRLHQTWTGLPQKNKAQLGALRRLADHSRNYHDYRTRLRNTAPPAVPFLGLYLTDVTFCREGNPSHRTSPNTPGKMLLNFNKYHKLARIVQDMQRFQVPYNLKSIPEAQAYLKEAFDKSKHHGDLQDLYRRSLLVEPRLPADVATPTSEMRQLFNWATRSQQEKA